MRIVTIIALVFSAFPAWAQDTGSAQPVRITETQAAVDVVHGGQNVRIQRVQDTGNRLIDDYAKTSRPCPPLCIQPAQAAPGVDTIAELELLDFMSKRVTQATGMVLDVRPIEFYRLETIPTSINVPVDVLSDRNPNHGKVLAALGGERLQDGRWDFRQARPLVLWTDGPWSDLAIRAIRQLIAHGYPADRLKYYRGGMQDWKKLGLTTVIPPRTKH